MLKSNLSILDCLAFMGQQLCLFSLLWPCNILSQKTVSSGVSNIVFPTSFMDLNRVIIMELIEIAMVYSDPWMAHMITQKVQSREARILHGELHHDDSVIYVFQLN